ncbi:MAG: transglutaminase domain-containing protein [Promethearchaeota archaeon]
MVSKRSVFAAISLVIILLLILSFFWPLLFQPLFPRQEPYDDVPDWGTGVVVEGGDDTFLDNITLDDITLDLNWTLDPSLTVAIVSPGDPPRYWRTTAYDRYIGTDWEKSNSTTEVLPTVSPGSEIVYHITQNISVQGVAGSFPLLSLWPDSMIITNSISCPTLPFPTSYDIATDEYGTAILNGRFSSTGSTTLEYDVTFTSLNWSTDIRPFARSASFTPADLLADYQQQGLSYLSSSTISDIQTRLTTILAGVPDNAFEEAFAILNYFKTTFAFDFFTPRPGPADEHVEWFLSQGSGIGVDFATVFTMFLRQSGIAARPVFGAVLGEDQGFQRVLHLMHLHFWVEVYIPVVGGGGYWVQFDPTPLPDFITDGSPPPPTVNKAPPPVIPDGDPYVISTSYDLSVVVTPPVVDRFVTVQMLATLTQDGNPAPGETLDFYDETEQFFLGTNVTTATGEASISFQYSNAAIIGFHILRVSFQSLSEYGGVGLHGPANLNLTVTPLEVNRTMMVRFNGTLSDSVNGRGISSSETALTGVNIFLGPTIVSQPLTDASGYYSVDYAIPMSQAPLGVTSAHVEFEIVGVIDFTISNWENLNITATSQLSVQALPNSIRLNSATILRGRLQFENGTGMPGQIIQLYWNDTLIGSNITDSAGYYWFNYTPPAIGPVVIEAQFTGASLIYGSSGFSTARVHQEGTIIVYVNDDDSDDVTQRGSWVYFSGWAEYQNGTSVEAGVPVIIFLNQTAIGATTTNTSGGFSWSYQLVNTLPVGTIEVSANITHTTLRVVSSLDYFIINSTTQLQNLQFNLDPVMLGETVTLTGQIIDDQGTGLSGQSLVISLSYLSLTIPIGSALIQPGGTFSVIYQIPLSVPTSVSTVTFDVTYSGTSYYGASMDSELLDVFSNASLLIEVPVGPFAWNESISVNGTLVDNFGRALPNRDAQVFVNGTSNFSSITNQLGQVAFVLRFTPSGENDVFYALQLRHETIITLNSSVRIITVEAQDIMQPPPPILIPPEWIAAIIVVVVIIVIVILVYRYWKRRPRQSAAPSIDASAMLTALRQLLSQQKYREAIIYAFRMYETIIQAKLGIFRNPSITVREFANLTVAHGRLDTRTMEVFIRGVEEARYSDHPISYNTALSSLNAFASLYNSLTGGNLRFVTQEHQQPESAEPERTETS